ncbi:AP-5 complex subunit sigma-1 [Microcaecilia unicolor]|uniref:AP-5 complex subunit sigma-1 n=1 Tax=Microcaecilia unicolor TaxID=1415580 RepID=A0A6P7X8H5_9AMPH|nr:AP-5 complex subunit sigma-1 [Microcaecilia unicolor]XP_030046845.1 AP-5 complex subunit sigma-1 [Microcaecilia unicolor]XP_030046846.1 AP-5 complex subunit sigma-1 [Microcaecilia unicolor]
MVHGFLIHTLGCSPSGDADLTRVLYSRTFSLETFDQAAELEKVRLLRKEQMLAVARHVTSACILTRQALEKPVYEVVVLPGEETVNLQDAESGVFSLAPGDPFLECKTVLWLGVLSLGFVLICDMYDNLTLAEDTLRLIVKYLIEHLRLLSQGSDVILKADKTETILNTFLPHGQLLFLNHQFILALEKEMNSSMAK